VSIHCLYFRFHAGLTSGCCSRAKRKRRRNSCVRKFGQLPSGALQKLKSLSCSGGILLQWHKSARFSRGVWSGCGFCASQLFRHIWRPRHFCHVGPNHSCYAIRLTSPIITVVFGEKAGPFRRGRLVEKKLEKWPLLPTESFLGDPSAGLIADDL